MTKNPFINAISASLYIIFLDLFMFYGSQIFPRKDTILTPIAVLSLITLSAAIMGYIFLSQPLMFFLDGHKKAGLKLFLQTIAIFAGITFFIFVLLFFGVFK